MSISVLPPSTVRTLVSAQVLLTPESVIKELVDNALDAGATSIFVEIDDTTVSYLCVRDNGSGVPQGEDRDLMCLRHATSKIESFDDLQSGKVQTLGFRGEALASLAEITGKLEVTTRAKGDIVAERWNVSKNGARFDTRHASQTQGTTVTAHALFQSIPVRKETYIKDSKKALLSISKHLRAIAMLRRGLRITFKVRRPISVPSVFTGEKTLSQGIRACLGKAAVSQSVFIREEFDDGWVIEAVMPKCDNTTQNLPRSSKKDFKQVLYAVDGRPLNISLPTAKRLSKLTKKYMRSNWRELVLCSITTPDGRASYDVNVEPGKDDILFYDENSLLEKWTQILETTYPEELCESHGDDCAVGADTLTGQEMDGAAGNFELYMRRNGSQECVGPNVRNDGNVDGDAKIEHVPKEDPIVESSTDNGINVTWISSAMHDNTSIVRTLLDEDNEQEDEQQGAAADENKDDDEEDYRQDINLHNPWVIAKMNRIQKPIADGGEVPSRHSPRNSTSMSLDISPPQIEIAQSRATSGNPDETATPQERGGLVYMIPLTGDHARNVSSDTITTSPIKRTLFSTVLSPSNTSVTQPSSPIEISPLRKVQARTNLPTSQPNSQLAAVQKKRSFFQMANLDQFMGRGSNGDLNNDAGEDESDGGDRRRSVPSLRPSSKSAGQSFRVSKKKNQPVQYATVPLEFIPPGEETYPYLIRLGYNGTTDMTDILDSDASLVMLANTQEQLRGSMDPYWLRETENLIRCWDDASLKRLVLSIAEKCDNKELKHLIVRMDLFRGDDEWMVFA
ncbi:hypothetical protein V1517DRAFT_266755 [Lipomyces orientalis]|uniref:Uncharacterized protein n=1 Tax=Lipomyces orientalis TaxID=1233043 RepID=A0ACC3TGC7_9ASCO